MLLADSIIATSLVAHAVILAIGESPIHRKLLVVSACIAVATSFLSVLMLRSIALLPMVVSVLFLAAAMLGTRADRSMSQRLVKGSACLVLVALAVLPLAVIAPTIEFPGLTGPYPVGVRSGSVTDPERGNAWNTMDGPPRIVALRIWYPAAQDTRGRQTQRLTDQEKHAARAINLRGINPIKLFRESLARSHTNSAWDVPVAAGTFPLLVFSHGYLGSMAENSALMEQVASHGYIVASVAHPGESSNLVDGDGELIPIFPEAEEVLEEMAQSDIWNAFNRSYAERLNWTLDFTVKSRGVKDRFPLWVDDFIAVSDALESGNVPLALQDVLDAADTQTLGYFGMSAGAAAAPLACHVDERCGGSVALDVLAGLAPLMNTSTRTPVMVFDSTVPSRMGGQDLFYEPYLSHGRDPDVHRIEFLNTGHLDFSDTGLAFTRLGKILMPRLLPLIGGVDAQKALRTQALLTVHFFDVYLKDADSGTFPQATLRSSGVARQVDPAPFRQWATSLSNSN